MKEFQGLPLFVWLLVCITIAIIYLFIVPKETKLDRISANKKFILRYGHSFVWVMLAGACIFAMTGTLLFVKSFILTGIVTYAIFIYTLVRAKQNGKKS